MAFKHHRYNVKQSKGKTIVFNFFKLTVSFVGKLQKLMFYKNNLKYIIKSMKNDFTFCLET